LDKFVINRIFLLDDNTANRIAAGEVVERPASAVKELVENSIDAGAKKIQIALAEGGKQRIEVIDDGCGMNQEDAVLSLQRHATSKIRTADDLFKVHTLGFRGEALPSIASVSHFTMKTRASEEDAGTQLIVHGGNLEEVETIGIPTGTTIIVEDLFYNTPARLKFLKTTSTEFARSIESIGYLAIANPQISFLISHNGQDILSTSGNGDYQAAISAVWGKDIARQVIPINRQTPGLNVSGYICPPEMNRPGRSHELFYVNGRPIKNRMLGHALEEALRSLTPEGRYPIAVIFIEINPEVVDVNVHPTKTEVKFTKDVEIHHAVSQAIKDALLGYGMVPTIDLDKSDANRSSSPGRGWSGSNQNSYQQHPNSSVDSKEAFMAMINAFMPETSSNQQSNTGSSAAPNETLPMEGIEPAPDDTRPFSEKLKGFRVLGQALNTYIIALTEQGLAVIDQHVAHERVLYERLTILRSEQGIPSQRLSIPITLALGAAESALLKQRIDDFASNGWDIEPFGRDTFLVRAVPSYAAKKEVEPLLRDMIDELAHQSVARRLIVQKEHVTITNACKMAVKAGDPLTMEEMTGLLKQLADTINPFMCPHGRPIVITIPFEHIHRQFKR
jgi:DNA mismatch repair protein MutL